MSSFQLVVVLIRLFSSLNCNVLGLQQISDGGCGKSNLTVIVDDPCTTLSPISRYNQSIGSIITFKCRHRISLDRSVKQGYCPVQTCQLNRTWSDPSLSCKETECYEPGNHYKGTRNCTRTGTQCRPWHEYEYIKQLQHLGNNTIFPDNTVFDAKSNCRDPGLLRGAPWCFTGHKNNTWEFCDIPKCGDLPVNDSSCRSTRQASAVDCGLPDFRIRADNKCVSIASLKPFDTTEGSIMDFSCKALQEGVTPRFNYCPVEVCQGDGTWRQAYISCAETECYSKEKPQDYRGRRTCTSKGAYCIPWTDTKLAIGDSSLFPDGSVAAAASYCRDPGGEKGSPWCFTGDTTWEYCGLHVCKEIPVERPSCIDYEEKTVPSTLEFIYSATTQVTGYVSDNGALTQHNDKLSSETLTKKSSPIYNTEKISTTSFDHGSSAVTQHDDILSSEMLTTESSLINTAVKTASFDDDSNFESSTVKSKTLESADSNLNPYNEISSSTTEPDKNKTYLPKEHDILSSISEEMSTLKHEEHEKDFTAEVQQSTILALEEDVVNTVSNDLSVSSGLKEEYHPDLAITTSDQYSGSAQAVTEKLSSAPFQEGKSSNHELPATKDYASFSDAMVTHKKDSYQDSGNVGNSNTPAMLSSTTKERPRSSSISVAINKTHHGNYTTESAERTSLSSKIKGNNFDTTSTATTVNNIASNSSVSLSRETSYSTNIAPTERRNSGLVTSVSKYYNNEATKAHMSSDTSIFVKLFLESTTTTVTMENSVASQRFTEFHLSNSAPASPIYPTSASREKRDFISASTIQFKSSTSETVSIAKDHPVSKEQKDSNTFIEISDRTNYPSQFTTEASSSSSNDLDYLSIDSASASLKQDSGTTFTELNDSDYTKSATSMITTDRAIDAKPLSTAFDLENLNDVTNVVDKQFNGVFYSKKTHLTKGVQMYSSTTPATSPYPSVKDGKYSGRLSTASAAGHINLALSSTEDHASRINTKSKDRPSITTRDTDDTSDILSTEIPHSSTAPLTTNNKIISETESNVPTILTDKLSIGITAVNYHLSTPSAPDKDHTERLTSPSITDHSHISKTEAKYSNSTGVKKLRNISNDANDSKSISTVAKDSIGLTTYTIIAVSASTVTNNARSASTVTNNARSASTVTNNARSASTVALHSSSAYTASEYLGRASEADKISNGVSDRMNGSSSDSAVPKHSTNASSVSIDSSTDSEDVKGLSSVSRVTKDSSSILASANNLSSTSPDRPTNASTVTKDLSNISALTKNSSLTSTKKPRPSSDSTNTNNSSKILNVTSYYPSDTPEAEILPNKDLVAENSNPTSLSTTAAYLSGGSSRTRSSYSYSVSSNKHGYSNESFARAGDKFASTSSYKEIKTDNFLTRFTGASKISISMNDDSSGLQTASSRMTYVDISTIQTASALPSKVPFIVGEGNSARFERVSDTKGLYWTKTLRHGTLLDCARSCKRKTDCKLFTYQGAQCTLYKSQGDSTDLTKELVCEASHQCYMKN